MPSNVHAFTDLLKTGIEFSVVELEKKMVFVERQTFKVRQRGELYDKIQSGRSCSLEDNSIVLKPLALLFAAS